MRSLYGKFLLFTLMIMIGSFIIAFLVVNTFYHQQLRPQNDAKNMQIAQDMASYIEATPDINLDDYLTAQANVGYKVFVTNDMGEEHFYGEPFRVENLSHQAINDVLDGNAYHGMRDLPTETFVTGFFSDEMANTVGTAFSFEGKRYGLFLRPDIKFLFTEIHYLLGGLFIVMALVSLIAMLFLARKLIQPITKLTTATKKVGAENFSVSLPINRGDEIGQLADSFQSMANQLQTSDELRKQFINDVSHDFQTPLQNIKGYAALLHDAEVSDIEQQQYAKVIETETERLSALTKQLLLLTSLDSLVTPIKSDTFSIDQQLKEVVRKNRWLMEEKNIALSLELNDVTYVGQAEYTEKIWENLISNALKYTPVDGMIDITLEETDTEVIVRFSDSGVGISEENIPHLFDRFYRVDDARHQGIEGTGLGLAIVEQAVSLHHGTIEVESQLQKGTTFVVRLPKM